MSIPESNPNISSITESDGVLSLPPILLNQDEISQVILNRNLITEYAGPFLKYRNFTPQIRQDGLLCSFGVEGTQKIIEGRKRLDFSKSIVNILTWESPGASAGGILPVVRNSAYGWSQMMKEREGEEAKGIPVRHFTPFHKNLITAEVRLGSKEVGTFEVMFEGKKISCKLHRYEDRKGCELNEKGAEWYFIDPVNEAEIFSAIGDGVASSGKNPYIYDKKHVSGHDNWRLALDSIFFSKAAIEAVNFLERKEKNEKPANQIFWGHDWQTATAAFEVCEQLASERFKSAAFFLQLHNFYDNILDSAIKGPLITNRNFPYDFKENTTFLDSMIRFVTGGPILTVSNGIEKATIERNPDISHMLGSFHKDLVSLHHDSKLRNFVGISNPRFEVTSDPLTTEERQLRKSDLSNFSKHFIAKKKQLALEFRELVNSSSTSKFGSLTNEDKPIFFSMGRDDLAQKGWLVLIDAIRNYPKGKAQFIIAIPQAPMDSEYIKELLQVVAERPGDIVFYNKGIFGREKELALKASTFMVFPSQYEPFGCAIEALANYTPVISRRTCGLEDQVIGYREDTENYNATGILYRENPSYSNNSRHLLRQARSIREVQNLPLLIDQRDRLINALDLGCELYLKDEEYTKLADNAYLHSLSFDQKSYSENIYNFLETVC
jgi:glycogen synthase